MTKICVYFGKLIDKGYPRKYSVSNYTIGLEPFNYEIDKKFTWEVFNWLKKEFPNECIDKGDSVYSDGTNVLVVSLDANLSEEIYFNADGELAKIYKEGNLNNLMDKFISEIRNKK